MAVGALIEEAHTEALGMVPTEVAHHGVEDTVDRLEEDTVTVEADAAVGLVVAVQIEEGTLRDRDIRRISSLA